MATDSAPAPQSRLPKLGPRKPSGQAASQSVGSAQRKGSNSAAVSGASPSKPPKLGPRKASATAAPASPAASNDQRGILKRPGPVPRQSSGRVTFKRQDSESKPARTQSQTSVTQAEKSTPQRTPSTEQTARQTSSQQLSEQPSYETRPSLSPAPTSKPRLRGMPKLGPRKSNAAKPAPVRTTSAQSTHSQQDASQSVPEQAVEEPADETEEPQPEALAKEPEQIATKEPEAAEEEEEPSLATVLNMRQRTQLTILLAAATATMRDNLSAAFDAESPDLRAAATQSEDDKIMNAKVDPGTADVAAMDKERKALEQRRKEVSTKEMVKLKKDAEEWFDSWREQLIGRVGEAVSSEKKAKQEIDGKESSKLKPGGKKGGEKKIEVSGHDERDDDEAERMLKELYPAVRTPLAKLDEDERVLILHSMLLLLLSMEHYASFSRILLLYLMSSLRLSLDTLQQDERKTAQGLLEAAKEMSASSEAQKRAEQYQRTRKWKVGLASVAGAAIVGVTGGMAAPMVAAGVGSMMGGLGLGSTAAAGYLGSVAGSSMLVGSLFGAYGGRMTGQMMDSYAKEVSDFAFIPVHPQQGSLIAPKDSGSQGEEEAGKKDPGQRRLRVTIGISGWLTEKEEVVKPWKVLNEGSEAFALRWELEALMNLGNAMNELVSSAVWGYAQKELISRTIFAELSSAMWPIALVKAARVVDNPFSLAKARAEKAGEVLADALINRAQGERPVNLVGYSLGARVIYSCLLKLAERNAFGLVENVVLMGAPLPSQSGDWRKMRCVVAGRLVNVFSENDYVLGFLYRTSSVQYGVAGLQGVEGVVGVENINVSESVNGHLRYRFMVGSILKKIGFEDIDLKQVEQEEAELKKMDEEEAQRTKAVTDKLPARFGKKGKGEQGMSEAEADKEADEMQHNVEEKTQSSLMQRSVELFHLGRDVKRQYDDARDSSYLNYASKLLSSTGGAEKEKPATKKKPITKKAPAKLDTKSKPAAEEKNNQDVKEDEPEKNEKTSSPKSGQRSLLNKASGGWLGTAEKEDEHQSAPESSAYGYTPASSAESVATE